MNQATSILFRMLMTGDINSAKTFLHIDSNVEELDIVRLLLDRGASVNGQDSGGWTPLHHAVNKCNASLSIVSELIQRGAAVNMQAKDGDTPLHLAILYGNNDIIRLFLDRGVNVDIQNSNGRSPLHYIAYCGSSVNVELATRIMDIVGNINLQDNHGCTALHIAIEECNNDIIRLLLDRGVNVDIQDLNGQSPLHNVAYHGSSVNVELATRIMDIVGNINLQDNDGHTALHIAIEEYNNDIIILLLCRGANVNAQDDRGQTPVHLSVSNLNTECLSTLLDWGGSMLIKDADGRTPYNYLDLDADLEFKDVLIQYIQRVKCAGLVNDVELWNVDVYDNSDYQTDLHQELGMMKQEELGWSCLYDVFGKYTDPLYANNEGLQAAIESPELDNNYPIYGELLKSTFNKGKRRLVLLNHAEEQFEVPLPVEVRRKILSYLDSSDLQCLISCYDQAQV